MSPLTLEELKELPEVKESIERCRTRHSDDEEDWGVWVNPKTKAIFTAPTDNPIRECILVYSIAEDEL